MKYLILIAFILASCSSYPKKRIGKVHDYQIHLAEKACENHEGYHYIIDITDIEGKYGPYDDRNDPEEFGSRPCTSVTVVRCQDETLHDISYGGAFCFISEMQLEETLKELDTR